MDVIYERDNGICHLCLNHVERKDASRDHIKPRSKGGRSKFDNFKLAHTFCNSRRGSKPVADFRAQLERELNAKASAATLA